MTDYEIREGARKIIFRNMIKGRKKDGRYFHYTKPSPERYPYQFFWDTCFHVFILAALDEYEMAKAHIKSLFALQESDGFVGHMIYWNRLIPGRWSDIFQSRPRLTNLYSTHMTALIQPPLAARAVERIYELGRDLNFLNAFLPKLKKYYDWIAKNRDLDGDGLVTIISPFESGMDWKPSYDVALGLNERKADWRLFLKVIAVDFRNYLNDYNNAMIQEKGYFLVKDVGLNTIYADNLKALSGLCKAAHDAEGEKYEALSVKVTKRMLEVMYDREDCAFYDTYGSSNQKIKVLTPTAFFPSVLNEIPDSITRSVIETHLINGSKFRVRYPLPSLAVNHGAFEPRESKYLWRGPTWVVNNWFLHQYLMEKGYDEQCLMLIDSIRELVVKSGFREYYNPFTGAGYGATDFTWSCLLVDMMRARRKYEQEGGF